MRTRILVVDFGGHPFQADLSRGLARRGHLVQHGYARDLLGPKGSLALTPEDPSSLSFKALGSGRLWRTFLLGRLLAGVNFGWALRREIRSFRPEFVIASNVPPEALWIAGFGGHAANWVWWVQDLLAPGSKNVLRRRSRVLAWVAGSTFSLLERRLARSAHAIVVISDAFKRYIEPSLHSKVTVLHNWAPITELPVVRRSNPWAAEHGLTQTFNFVYTGTLGMKHDPDLLVELVRSFESDPEARLVVTSEGPGADYLRAKVRDLGLSNFLLLPFQPYSRLPEVMGTADVLLAVLESDAGEFSVPSKILSYLCAGRPILASMPLENLASKILMEANVGIVVSPEDRDSFLERAKGLLAQDRVSLEASGSRARRFAEESFDIERVLDRFEDLMGLRGSSTDRGFRRATFHP